jgi:3-hydroxy-9,10-secoandrosta-1,3,5(10)-triene-9,17-dione monooxygenase reductase component
MTVETAARTPAEQQPTPVIDMAVMREVLGHFVSGIVVVTAVDSDGPVGFTCQSFYSLSLDPPLVSLSPALTSKSWPRIRAVGHFCVNVLAAEHSEHSRNFARSTGDRFAGVRWSPAPSGAPVLEGVSAWIDCALHQEYVGGDHSIALGRVTALGSDADRPPLLYYRGVYHGTAPLPPAPLPPAAAPIRA